MTGHPSTTAPLPYYNVGQALASTLDQLDADRLGPISPPAERELDSGFRGVEVRCSVRDGRLRGPRKVGVTCRQTSRETGLFGGRPAALGYSRVWHRGPDIQLTEDRSPRRHHRHRDTAVTLPPTLLNRYRQTEAPPKKDHLRPMHPSEVA